MSRNAGYTHFQKKTKLENKKMTNGESNKFITQDESTVQHQTSREVVLRYYIYNIKRLKVRDIYLGSCKELK